MNTITIILAFMGIGALRETTVPMFTAKVWTRERRTANLAFTALFVSNWLLASMAAVAAVALRPAGAFIGSTIAIPLST